MTVIAASPYRVPKSVGTKGDFGHFRSSEQHADSTNRLARYAFLLVFYSELRSRWTVVELKSREIQGTKVC